MNIGFINEKGNKVIEFQFLKTSDFRNGLCRARKDEKWGYINKEGIYVIPPVYRNAEDFMRVE